MVAADRSARVILPHVESDQVPASTASLGALKSPVWYLQPRLTPNLREEFRLRRYGVLGCPVWAWTGHPAR